MGASRELAELASVVTVSNGNVGIGTSSPASKLDVNGSINGSITSGTAVTASGTSVDFTGIPAIAKRITVMFDAVSTNGTSIPQIQIGTSGGIQTTGYLSYLLANSATASLSSGFALNAAVHQANVTQYFGIVVLVLIDGSVGRWASSVTLGVNAGGAVGIIGAGSKTLSGTLDRVRITTVNGTDAFDAGTINIMWEA